MHPLAFYQKRAHLCVLARGREMFAHVEDMTPARFDILYLMYRNGPPRGRRAGSLGYGLELARITAQLGLARQTIWKAARRLIEIGLVRAEKGPPGARVTLYLTEEGIRRVRAAIHAAFSERRPLPKDAPATGALPRYWRHRELADPASLVPVPPAHDGTPRTTLGRDVERIYSSFIWDRIRMGRRGKRSEHFRRLERMIDHASALAHAFGNRAESFYTLRFIEQAHH